MRHLIPLTIICFCGQRAHPAQGNGSDGHAPAAAAAAAAPAPAADDTLSPGPKPSVGRGPRTPRKHGAQKTQLEAVDDSLGPLGPLGDNFEASMTVESEQPPAPPYKESPAGAGLRDRPSPPQTSASRGALDSADVGDDDDDDASARLRTAPPLHKTAAAASPQPQRQTRPSVPIEQAAKPKFDIAVGDPHKVGDLTSSHIVYQVRTKVRAVTPSRPSTDRDVAADRDGCLCRRRPKRTGSRSLLSVVDIATFSGCTTSCTTTALASSSRRRRRSRPLAGSTQISSSRGERRSSACSTEWPRIRSSSTTAT